MSNEANRGVPFAKGNPGRPRGSRNKLTGKFIEALCADFEQHGEEAIKICRLEEPAMYLRIVASLLPRELDISDSRLKDIDDNELDALIELVRSRVVRSGDAAKLDS